MIRYPSRLIPREHGELTNVQRMRAILQPEPVRVPWYRQVWATVRRLPKPEPAEGVAFPRRRSA